MRKLKEARMAQPHPQDLQKTPLRQNFVAFDLAIDRAGRGLET
jgi:hypothetical protein